MLIGQLCFHISKYTGSIPVLRVARTSSYTLHVIPCITGKLYTRIMYVCIPNLGIYIYVYTVIGFISLISV